MPGPLALVGGDELKPGNEPQDELLVRAAGEVSAYVLATAAARQRPELAVRNAKRWFARLGLTVEELPARKRSEVRSDLIATQAAAGRFFYLVGGDPGLVVDMLRDTPVWEAIVSSWEKGAALAGSSAGAMALGEWTLVRGRFPGDSYRRYKDALGLVPGIAVLPHFERFGHTWIDSARASALEAVLVGIDERSAAVWVDGSWRAFGPGGVTVIAGGATRRFEPGERIEGILGPAC